MTSSSDYCSKHAGFIIRKTLTTDSVIVQLRSILRRRPSVETLAALAHALPIELGRVFTPGTDFRKTSTARAQLEAAVTQGVHDLNNRELRALVGMCRELQEVRRCAHLPTAALGNRAPLA